MNFGMKASSSGRLTSKQIIEVILGLGPASLGYVMISLPLFNDKGSSLALIDCILNLAKALVTGNGPNDLRFLRPNNLILMKCLILGGLI